MINGNKILQLIKVCKNPLYPTSLEKSIVNYGGRTFKKQRTSNWFSKFGQWMEDFKYLNGL